jgi:hypothetical protein
MLKVIADWDKKFIETSLKIDPFTPDVGSDLKFVIYLGMLTYLNKKDKKCC